MTHTSVGMVDTYAPAAAPRAAVTQPPEYTAHTSTCGPEPEAAMRKSNVVKCNPSVYCFARLACCCQGPEARCPMEANRCKPKTTKCPPNARKHTSRVSIRPTRELELPGRILPLHQRGAHSRVPYIKLPEFGCHTSSRPRGA